MQKLKYCEEVIYWGQKKTTKNLWFGTNLSSVAQSVIKKKCL